MKTLRILELEMCLRSDSSPVEEGQTGPLKFLGSVLTGFWETDGAHPQALSCSLSCSFHFQIIVPLAPCSSEALGVSHSVWVSTEQHFTLAHGPMFLHDSADSFLFLSLFLCRWKWRGTNVLNKSVT